jgi:hypothetical protein
VVPFTGPQWFVEFVETLGVLAEFVQALGVLVL